MWFLWVLFAFLALNAGAHIFNPEAASQDYSVGIAFARGILFAIFAVGLLIYIL